MILIPVILNLNGNLLLNLTARLGTSANTGELDNSSSRNSIILGNMYILQVQAGVVSLVAAGVAEVLAHILPPGLPNAPHKTIGSRSWRLNDLYKNDLNIETRRPRPTLPPMIHIGGLAE